MTSKETWRIAAKFMNLGFKLKCLPYKFVVTNTNSTKEEAETSSSLQIAVGNSTELLQWYYLSLGNLIVKIIFIGFGITYDFMQEETMLERSEFYLMVCVFLMSLSVQVCTIFFWKRIQYLVEVFIKLDERMGKLYQKLSLTSYLILVM